MARVNARLGWLSRRGAALAALEQAQANGEAIATLTTAFIEWSTKMTDAMGRAEAAAEQDTIDDQIARDTIAELRSNQAQLVQAANDAIAQSGLDAQAKADAEAKVQELSDRADALAVKLAGSSPVDTDTLPPPDNTGGGTEEPPPAPDEPHPDNTLPGDLPPAARGRR